MSAPEPSSDADGLVRVYPAAETGGVGFVWVHGGGFAGGDLDMPEADAVARFLAARGITVASVDYRLAPLPEEWARHSGESARSGSHYPAASDDVVHAWRWTIANAARLGLDAERIALGGASAGGNLVAGAVLRMLADGADALPARVVLAYPTLHAVQPAPSDTLAQVLANTPADRRFTPEVILGMYENFLGRGVDDAPVPAIPGRASASDLRRFPATLIVDSELDDLRISGEAFAAALIAAGRSVELVTEPGTTHGHLNQPDDPAFARSMQLIADRLTTLSVTR
ncbi:alpha/beta hydrolase fold domain-containing protein [Microbacterium sp. NPDC091313]